MSGARAEGNAGDKPCVSIKCANCLASLGIPQFHRGVITSTNNPVSIRAEGHAVDVPFECHDELHSRRCDGRKTWPSRALLLRSISRVAPLLHKVVRLRKRPLTWHHQQRHTHDQKQQRHETDRAQGDCRRLEVRRLWGSLLTWRCCRRFICRAFAEARSVCGSGSGAESAAAAFNRSVSLTGTRSNGSTLTGNKSNGSASTGSLAGSGGGEGASFADSSASQVAF